MDGFGIGCTGVCSTKAAAHGFKLNLLWLAIRHSTPNFSLWRCCFGCDNEYY